MSGIRSTAIATAGALALLAIGPQPALGVESSGSRMIQPPPIIRAPVPAPVPEIRAMDPADVERLQREEAARDAARRAQTERDITRWEAWHERGKEAKVFVGWANNVVGGAAIAACLTGVGCIPVAIYVGGKVVEVILVSHSQASSGTDFVGRMVNGSARSEDYWRRVRVNGFGTMASEAMGLAGGRAGLPPVDVAGAGAMAQDAMGEAMNEGYEALQARSERIAQEARQRRAERDAYQAYVSQYGPMHRGFPLPVSATPR